jgi:hypothetical protein
MPRKDNMTARSVVMCLVLALGIALVPAPAGACEPPGCRPARSKSLAMPLQLDRFMRHNSKTVARARTAKAGQRTDRVGTPPVRKFRPAARHRPAPVKPPPDRMQALALLAPPLVREVPSDELNEIDLAAGTIHSEEGATAFAGENSVRFADASEVDDIDRRASADNVGLSRNPPSDRKPAVESWAVRVWTMLHAAFVALAAAVRWLVVSSIA